MQWVDTEVGGRVCRSIRRSRAATPTPPRPATRRGRRCRNSTRAPTAPGCERNSTAIDVRPARRSRQDELEPGTAETRGHRRRDDRGPLQSWFAEEPGPDPPDCSTVKADGIDGTCYRHRIGAGRGRRGRGRSISWRGIPFAAPPLGDDSARRSRRKRGVVCANVTPSATRSSRRST